MSRAPQPFQGPPPPFWRQPYDGAAQLRATTAQQNLHGQHFPYWHGQYGQRPYIPQQWAYYPQQVQTGPQQELYQVQSGTQPDQAASDGASSLQVSQVLPTGQIGQPQFAQQTEQWPEAHMHQPIGQMQPMQSYDGQMQLQPTEHAHEQPFEHRSVHAIHLKSDTVLNQSPQQVSKQLHQTEDPGGSSQPLMPESAKPQEYQIQTPQQTWYETQSIQQRQAFQVQFPWTHPPQQGQISPEAQQISPPKCPSSTEQQVIEQPNVTGESSEQNQTPAQAQPGTQTLQQSQSGPLQPTPPLKPMPSSEQHMPNIKRQQQPLSPVISQSLAQSMPPSERGNPAHTQTQGEVQSIHQQQASQLQFQQPPQQGQPHQQMLPRQFQHQPLHQSEQNSDHIKSSPTDIFPGKPPDLSTNQLPLQSPVANHGESHEPASTQPQKASVIQESDTESLQKPNSPTDGQPISEPLKVEKNFPSDSQMVIPPEEQDNKLHGSDHISHQISSKEVEKRSVRQQRVIQNVSNGKDQLDNTRDQRLPNTSGEPHKSHKESSPPCQFCGKMLLAHDAKLCNSCGRQQRMDASVVRPQTTSKDTSKKLNSQQECQDHPLRVRESMPGLQEKEGGQKDGHKSTKQDKASGLTPTVSLYLIKLGLMLSKCLICHKGLAVIGLLIIKLLMH